MTQITNEAKQYITFSKQNAPYYTLPVAEARAARATLASTIPVASLATIHNTTFKARDDQDTAVRIYTPKGQGPFPIIIYYHGGGWVFGDLNYADAGCQLLAQETHSIVVSVDYRLAPEYKFPVPLYDAFDGLKWVHQEATSFNGLPDQISVVGDSAGGNLATVVTHLAKQEKGPKISAQALIYPVTDISRQSSSYDVFGENYGLDRKAMEWFAAHYITKNVDIHNPLISPLLAEDVTGLPKTLIIAAEADVLYDEGVAYAEKLKAANVPTEHTVVPGLIHSYFSKMQFFEKATITTVQQIARFLRK